MSDTASDAGREQEIAPGTPLPWRWEVVEERVARGDWELAGTSVQEFRASVRLDAMVAGRPVNVLPVVDMSLNYLANVRYIVEACNAYPALRDRVRRLEDALRLTLGQMVHFVEAPLRSVPPESVGGATGVWACVDCEALDMYGSQHCDDCDHKPAWDAYTAARSVLEEGRS